MNRGLWFALLLFILGVFLMITYNHWAPGFNAMFGVHK